MSKRLAATLVAMLFCGSPVASPCDAGQDILLQAVSFAVTGSDASPVDVVDRQNCVFIVRQSTYYFNNIYSDRITTRSFVAPAGNYTLVDIHGSTKIADIYSWGSKTDYSLHVQTMNPIGL
jgi:hypothetical protein